VQHCAAPIDWSVGQGASCSVSALPRPTAGRDGWLRRARLGQQGPRRSAHQPRLDAPQPRPHFGAKPEFTVPLDGTDLSHLRRRKDNRWALAGGRVPHCRWLAAVGRPGTRGNGLCERLRKARQKRPRTASCFATNPHRQARGLPVPIPTLYLAHTASHARAGVRQPQFLHGLVTRDFGRSVKFPIPHGPKARVSPRPKDAGALESFREGEWDRARERVRRGPGRAWSAAPQPRTGPISHPPSRPISRPLAARWDTAGQGSYICTTRSGMARTATLLLLLCAAGALSPAIALRLPSPGRLGRSLLQGAYRYRGTAPTAPCASPPVSIRML
jgi:hypothetical protein